MKLEVLRGILHPLDEAKKSGRYGVVLARLEGFVLIAPATSYFERTGIVVPGSVLLSNKSEAYQGCGFTIDNVLISIRDMVEVREDSIWLSGAQVVGHLDLCADQRFKEHFIDECKKFPPRGIVY